MYIHSNTFAKGHHTCTTAVLSLLIASYLFSVEEVRREGVLGRSVCVHWVISKCILDMSVVYVTVEVEEEVDTNVDGLGRERAGMRGSGE